MFSISALSVFVLTYITNITNHSEWNVLSEELRYDTKHCIYYVLLAPIKSLFTHLYLLI